MYHFHNKQSTQGKNSEMSVYERKPGSAVIVINYFIMIFNYIPGTVGVEL